MKRQYKRALLLEYFTVGYNMVEAVVAIAFGAAANSVALIGFGMDSIVGYLIKEGIELFGDDED